MVERHLVDEGRAAPDPASDAEPRRGVARRIPFLPLAATLAVLVVVSMVVSLAFGSNT